jgi:hypothetical protein
MIHKKGEMGKGSNYWTITIGPALEKLYMVVVERRLSYAMGGGAGVAGERASRLST